MSSSDRRLVYKKIEDYRRRPLIVYATSTRPNVAARMASDAIREFIAQIDLIDDAVRDVDVLVHSTGGDGLTAWKLMSVLRERFDRVSVLVPFQAFSAATIFALGADEIIMHPHASLGPIDPQISSPGPNGTQVNFAYEDVGAFLRFILDDVGLSEQPQLAVIVDKLFAQIACLSIGHAKRASDLASDVGERLLLTHMSKEENGAEHAKKIALELNKSFFDHADAIPRRRAKALNLKIADPNPVLEGLIWEAYVHIEGHMELRKPFNALSEALKDPAIAKSLAPLPGLSFPLGTPPHLQAQAYQQAVATALGASSMGAAPAVSFTLVHAIVESEKLSLQCLSEGKISACRVGQDVKVSQLVESTGWREVPW